MVKKNLEKTLFVAATQLTPVDGHIHIPTALCYENEEKVIGTKAVMKTLDSKVVNRNFKVLLGQYVLGKLRDENQRFYCEDGKDRTAYDLSKDFFDEVLDKVEGQNTIPNYEKKGLKIMVAEPLSPHIDERESSAWIKNYRDNIERILSHYESVEFLPEPFAVYQYYRYGLRIPQVVEKIKNIALIIDFGGGTFDVSIIETTNTGDITKGGKNSSPHAGASYAIGGYYINQKIAEYLMLRTSGESNAKKASQCIDSFIRVTKGQLDLLALNAEKQAFIKNIRRLIEMIEYPKIELCQKIVNWDMKSDCYEKIQVEIPEDPFSETSKWKGVSLQGHELRKLFKDEIWNVHLKKAIKQAFKRAEEKLKDKSITVTLISGGSSNIRWLEKLLVADFADELKGARPIPLSESFQEIVAKGLAIECARRQYNPDSEFVSVTYNPIRLLLNADDHGIEERSFSSIDNKIDMEGASPGILIPSAQALHNFIGEPLQWKFKISHPPRRSLKYHFTRPSEQPLAEQPNDSEAVYNVDNEVYSPKDVQFDGKLRVELIFKKDGTATPKFIYKAASEHSSIPECSVTGKPFVVDMTSEITKVEVTKYIGLDFGTSNSAICYLSNDVVEMIESKGKDASWLGLKDLIAEMPYPIAFAIKKYLNCSMIDPDKCVDSARQAFEAMLAFAAYIAVAELSTIGGVQSIFKSYTQRSMGPLKKLLDDCLHKMRKKAYFSSPFQKIIGNYLDDMNAAISQLTDHKHDTISSSKVDVHQQLSCLANICREAMKGKVFGFVEQCNSQRFKRGAYEGFIRVGGDSQPFVDKLPFISSVQFLKNEPLLVDVTTGNAISLYPLYYVEECNDRSGEVKIYVFDKHEKDVCKYKLVDEDTRIDVEFEITQAILAIKVESDYISDTFFIKVDDIL